MSLNRFLFFCFLLPLLLCFGAGGAWMYNQHQMVQVDSSANRLLDSDPRSRELFDKFNELLPDAHLVMVAIRMENLFSDQGAATLAKASDQLMSVEGAMEVKSLTHSFRPVFRGMRLEFEKIIPLQATPQKWDEIREFTTRFPLSRNTLVSEDARFAILIGVFRRPLPDHSAREAFRQEFMNAMEPVVADSLSLHVLSFPFIEAEGVNTVISDLKLYGISAGLLILIVLLLTFRSPVTVMTVLILEAAGVLILLGVFRCFDRPVDLYSGILFPLVGGLQLTFVVHYLSALQQTCQRVPVRMAARSAFREVFPPSCLAALTTITGLLTLAFSDLPTLTDFGRIGATTVGVVFLFTFFFPALCAIGRPPSGTDPVKQSDKKHPLPVRSAYGFIILALSFCLVISFGIFRIKTDIRAVEFIEPGHPIRESLELLDNELGGINIFQVNVDTGTPYGIQTPQVLEYFEKLRTYAYQREGVADAYAYSQLYLAMSQLIQGDKNPTGTLPKNPAVLASFSMLINQTPLLFADSFIGPQSRSALMILRTRNMPAKDYLAMLEDFMGYATEHAPEGVILQPAKGLHTILEGDRKIVSNQLKTLGITLGFITLLLTLLWFSLKLALLILLANVPALLTIFGMMGYTGYPMNSITIMVAAVILGIAVDDGIHLVSAFRKNRKQGMDPKSAASEALRRKLKPMACTSSILAVFLGLLVLTSFPPVAHFGILSALGIFAAFMGAVVLLPGFLGNLSDKS